MNASDPWLSLRTGKTLDGLKEFQRSYQREPSSSHIMELGVAYLWVRQYENAWDHFSKSIKAYPESMSSFYGMAGAAKWCLGDVAAAIRHWQDGLNSRYADTNGLGVHLPLLLLVASVLKPESFENSSAVKLLKEKAEDRRINRWPGPIALWVIGKKSKSELDIDAQPVVNWRLRSGGDANEVETLDRQWLTSFYDSVFSFGVENKAAFTKAMQELADTSAPPWKNDDFFLARMWSEEFFLARHEAEANPTRQQ